jgi:hypothetical protein
MILAGLFFFNCQKASKLLSIGDQHEIITIDVIAIDDLVQRCTDFLKPMSGLKILYHRKVI